MMRPHHIFNPWLVVEFYIFQGVLSSIFSNILSFKYHLCFLQWFSREFLNIPILSCYSLLPLSYPPLHHSFSSSIRFLFVLIPPKSFFNIKENLSLSLSLVLCVSFAYDHNYSFILLLSSSALFIPISKNFVKCNQKEGISNWNTPLFSPVFSHFPRAHHTFHQQCS